MTINIDPETSLKSMQMKGLKTEEVLELRAKYGINRLPKEKEISVWKIILNQLKSPLVYIILAAAGVSLALGETGDFLIIMFVVVVDVVLGFAQEYRAQRTYTALKNLLKPTATVIRDLQRVEVEVWELVPGDLVVLNAGEKVPGDGILIEALKLSCDESILTGESEPLLKQAFNTEVEDMLKAIPQDSLVSMGTTVVTGRGILKINGTGLNTELGQIAKSMIGQEEEETPFQIRLKVFSKLLTYIVVTATISILTMGVLMGREFFEMLRTSIVLAIAAVPEGLLIAVTVILVLGMRKILKRNGLVKKLLAVETLGSVTVICTDKTGTLTEGRMRISAADMIETEKAWQIMVLCNNLEGPVDIALWEYAEEQKPGMPQALCNSSVRQGEELFTSEKKYMITAVTGSAFQRENFFFLKGAPEIILDMCEISAGEQERIMKLVDDWADQGLRLLGLAYRKDGLLEHYAGYHWAGLVGMEDPVREGVVEAIQVAQQAGIQIKIITGDYRRTAERIASIIGLVQKENQSLEGKEIAAMTDLQLQEKVQQTTVFSRIHPQDKFRIIRALQANSEITAMIGDGVNDAPAIKRADIGVVVGSATDVAKETADLILLDNNFKTIVAAVEEGRIIFANIQKVVAYTLSNSFAEVLTIFIAMVLQWPAPLAVAQILWIHLICDGPSDIVLGFEPKEYGVMDEKPRPLKDPILTPLALTLILVISISSAIFVLIIFGHFYQVHNDPVQGRSIAFASFAINSMVYIFAYRSMRLPIYKMNRLSANKPLIWAVISGLLTAFVAFWIPELRNLLGIVPLSLEEWIWVIGFAILLLAIVEVGKAVANRKSAVIKYKEPY